MHHLFDERRGWLQVPLVVWVAAAVFALGWSVVGWWMYMHWLYPGYDLAIFDQVVWNTAHGHWFAYSFNPYSYLADHREWALLVLVPLYWVVPHPVTLLVVQAVVVASTAVPLYRIAARTWRSTVPAMHAWHRSAVWAGVGVVGIFLVHPSVQGMLTYEFHALTLTLPFICWLWDAVQRGRFGQMWMWTVAVLLIRDDMALVVIGIGVLLWCVRELSIRCRVLHGVGLVAIGAAWFAANQWIGSVANPEGVSKFFVFYQWMGDTPFHALVFILQHPLRVLSQLFQFDHLFAPLFFIACVGGLALVRPRLLIPALVPLVVLLIDRPVGLAVVKLHYSAFVVPWTLMAAAEGFAAGARRLALRPPLWVLRYGGLSIIVVVVGAVVMFQSAMLSPIQDVWIQHRSLAPSSDTSYERALSFVGPDDAVMASRRLYTRLAHRINLYPTLHVHTGVKHYSTVPYEPPPRVDWLLLETDEVMAVEVASQHEWRSGAGWRFQYIIDANHLVLRYESADVAVYGLPAVVDTAAQEPAGVFPPQLSAVSALANADIRVTGWAVARANDGVATHDVWLQMERVAPRRTTAENVHARMEWLNDAGEAVGVSLYPIGTGIAPTVEWEYDQTPHRVRIPVSRPKGATAIRVSVGPVIQRPVFPFVVLAQPVQLDPKKITVIGTALLP